MALNIEDKDMNQLDDFEPSDTSTFGKFLEWIHSWINTLREEIIDRKTEINNVDKKFEDFVVFGTYTGNGEASRFIELDFTPVAVEVYNKNGLQGVTSGGGNETFGGLAFTGFNCHGDCIKIDTGGFYVAQDHSKKLTNRINEIYYFKAYRYGKVKTYA